MSPVTRSRLVVLTALGTLFLFGCDRYVEQASLRPDGSVAFLAEADLVCSDPLQNAVFGSDPCSTIESVVAGDFIGPAPLGVDLGPGFDYELSGDLDRRRLLVRWQGSRDDFRSLLVSGVVVTSGADEDRTEARFTTRGTPFDRLRSSTDPVIVDARSTARWAVGEFRAIAPAVVVEHNGDRLDGRTVIWEFDDDVPDTLMLAWSNEERSIRIWWWFVGAAILGGVLVMIVLVEGRPPTPKTVPGT